METTPLARYFVHEGSSAFFVGLVLFGCAGQVRWWPGWVELALTLSLSAAIGVIGLCMRPNLLVERVGSRRGDERWDVAVYAAIRMGLLACLVVAGLDRRLGWTGAFDFGIQIVGFAVHLLGNTLFIWAVASNRFFSDMVRGSWSRRPEPRSPLLAAWWPGSERISSNSMETAPPETTAPSSGGSPASEGGR